ncbi:hypothetical protein J6A31_06340 [bacterium]|nr:hypothetical protein [bacterium]
MIHEKNLKKGKHVFFIDPITKLIGHGDIIDYSVNSKRAVVVIKSEHYPCFGMISQFNNEIFETEIDAKAYSNK